VLAVFSAIGIRSLAVRTPHSTEVLRFLSSYVLGGAVTLIGLTVIIGWIIHDPALIQIDPAWAPMQFNAALGFMLLGSCVFVLGAFDRVVPARILALIAAILGATTLSQYLFGLELGIDELFIDHYIAVETSHPGRMAPNTALCMLLSGLALFASTWRPKHLSLLLLVQAILGLGVLLLGFIAWYGYQQGYIGAYGWDRFTRMAIHTAVGYMAVGLSVLLRAMYLQQLIESSAKGVRNAVVAASSLAVAATGIIVGAQALISMAAKQLETEEDNLKIAARTQAVLVEEYLVGLGDIGRQVASRTQARRLLESYNNGQINLGEYQESSKPIIIDAAKATLGIVGISRLDQRDIPLIEVGNTPSSRYWPKATLVPSQTILGPLVLMEEVVFITRTPILNNKGESLGSDIIAHNLSSLVDPEIILDHQSNQSEHWIAAASGEVVSLDDASRPPSQGALEASQSLIKSQSSLIPVTTTQQGVFHPTLSKQTTTTTLLSYWRVAERPLWIIHETPLAAVAKIPIRGALQPISLSLLLWILICVAGLTMMLRPLIDGFVQYADNLRISLDTQRRELAARRRLQHELEEKKQELESANKDLTQFATIAAHDLKEPIRVMSNYLGLIKSRYGGKLDESGNKYLKNALKAGQRAIELNEGLLELAQIGTRAQQLETLELEKCLKEAQATLFERIQERDAQISAEPLPKLLGEPQLLTQLLINLLSNAIKFCPDRTPEIFLSVREEDDHWEFCLRDNGMGIDPLYHEVIFEGFERLNGRHEYHGAGLGLAISKRIIERHAGKIWVKSHHGTGSRFFFTISKNPPGIIDKTEITAGPLDEKSDG